ncbi:hypothetical protein [Anaplasma marginale]|uniref:hypothetical protein n=1 Tax=Anaplasma marginale TaxID=770 RepID=UPI0018DF930B|nr:hypothetical protein [Anaplasma marginale]
MTLGFLNLTSVYAVCRSQMKIKLNRRRKLVLVLVGGFVLWLLHYYRMREGARMLSAEERREIVLELHE